MSTLSWFFRNTSSSTTGSNLSQELRRLCNSVERIALSADLSNKVTSDYFDKWVQDIYKQGAYKPHQIIDLTEKIKGLPVLTNEAKDIIKSVIVALIVVAKQSTSIRIRNNIIELAKSIKFQ